MRLEAVYENGVFRPLTRPEGIAEHRRVTLTVMAEEHPASLADFIEQTGGAGGSDWQKTEAWKRTPSKEVISVAAPVTKITPDRLNS